MRGTGSYTRLHRSQHVQSPGAPDIWYLHPLLAFLVGIVHAAIAPVIVLGGVKPNLVLIAVVLVTVLVGFLPGITWAFVAGLAANLLVGAPLGSVPLTMLIVVGLVSCYVQLFNSFRFRLAK